MRAVFLDRDGTVSVGVPKYKRVNAVNKVELLPDTIEALRLLAGLDYGVFFVTNQAGIAEGALTTAEFEAINDRVLELIAPSGVRVLKTYVCPHGEDEDCACRKPKPKMLLDAARDYDIELEKSWMIGDLPSDVMTGVNAGTKTILVLTGYDSNRTDRATYTAPSLLGAVRYIVKHRD